MVKKPKGRAFVNNLDLQIDLNRNLAHMLVLLVFNENFQSII